MACVQVIPLPKMVEHAVVVKWLGDARVYPDCPSKVDLVETHISHLFLTERFVYKIKKQVQFDFLDFSTLAKREQACRDELRLNRRMSRDSYLAIVPITQESCGDLRFNGAGKVIEWVVIMRRFPAERMLDELIRTDRLTDTDTQQLADYLGRYYATAEPLIVRPDEFIASLLAHVEGNFRTLLAATNVNVAQVRRIHVSQLRMIKSRPETFLTRVREGRIIDGHGDLRPEHLCLLDQPAAFDCLEFNDDLRRVDVLDELCFLAMECDALQAGAVGVRVLDDYIKQSRDQPSSILMAFYKCYRACVRAKVSALRAAQVTAKACNAQQLIMQQYLDLADGYVRAAGARPLLILVTGLMGSGKSTLARALAEELGTQILRTDELRKELFPVNGQLDSFGQGRYQSDARTRVYDELLRQAGERLSASESTILDGTFTLAAPREAVLQIARDQGADLFVIECVCPRGVALQRIQARLHQASADASEARLELYDQQSVESQRESRTVQAFQVDTTASLKSQLGQIIRALPDPFPKHNLNENNIDDQRCGVS